MEGALRSALVVVVPPASTLVDAWRERTCRAKPTTGVPAHVTVLWPFVEAAGLDRELLEDLRSLFRTVAAFEFRLRATARFAETLYLVPEPAERFTELTRAVHRAYPDYPPYAGVFDEVVPHLTAAQGDAATLAEAERAIRPGLPLRGLAREVVLLQEVAPDRWRVRSAFALADRATG